MGKLTAQDVLKVFGTSGCTPELVPSTSISRYTADRLGTLE